MRLVFWQNVVSIHQSAFIKALAKDHEVTLVVAEKIDEQRLRERWNVPSMGDACVIVAPSDDQIADLISWSDAYHVFSGINAFPMVYKAFKLAVKRGHHVSIMVEPYEWAGVRGAMRRIMYASLYVRYGKHIDHVFATGNMGVRCYRKAGFPARKIHQWGYFTEQGENNPKISKDHSLPSLIFIGKIDERKNILLLAKCASRLFHRFEKFTIIGTGPLESELKNVIKDTPNIEFIGSILNSEIGSYLAKSDLLVLPSLFDGWGAVVNEALTQGTRVLCSNHCGAETLLDGEKRGGTFVLEKQGDLEDKISYWLDKGVISDEERSEIRQWAEKSISGESASWYFKNAINLQIADIPWVNTPPHSQKVNLLYVGRIDRNKNILKVLKEFDQYGKWVNRFSIVGDGPLMDELRTLAESNPKIVLMGRHENKEISDIMAQHDYLILPSLYDGWGAVVNEALAVGTPVLCSDACGASILLDGGLRGESFSQTSMIEIIKKRCEQGYIDRSQRTGIKTWAISHISGEDAAEYFCSILRGNQVNAPWVE